MLLTFGKYEGRTVDELVLKDPGNLLWMLAQPDPAPSMARACEEARRLVAVFNSKPFLRDCTHRNCHERATVISVYQGNPRPLMFWCEQCDPHSHGAAHGRLYVVHTYQDAVRLSRLCGLFSMADMKYVIRHMAIAKGLADRVGKRQAQAFFAR